METQKNLWNDPLSALVWWYDLAIFLLMFPSNSIIVFLRKRLGYRLMKPWVMAVTFFLILIVGSTGAGIMGVFLHLNMLSTGGAETPAPSSFWPLLIFAVLMVGLTLYHRHQGWQQVFDTAEPLHSMARGESYLQRPLSFLSEYQVQRYAEPLIVVVLGVVFQFIPAMSGLGTWLILSGFSLAVIESLITERMVNDMLDRHDARIEAALVRLVDAAKAERSEPTDTMPKLGGVTLSPEIQRLRAARLAAEGGPAAA